MRNFVIIILLCLSVTIKGQMPPVPDLPYSSLEEVGFNRDSMDVLINDIYNFDNGDFTGLVIIKDHKLVTEWHFNTFWRKQILDIRSAGKSITSLLLGVAMEEGLVQSIDQDVYSFFPKEKYPNIHEDYKKIKISHLLNMASGLDADTDRGETPGHAVNWSGKEEWVQYILGVPLANKPGEKWVYADINAAVIGAIIEETSGMSLRDFANKHVFKPMGIKQFFWFTNEANQTVAAGTLYISTLDFAKLGVLVANNGQWADKQIVQSEYVEKLIASRDFDLTDYWALTDAYGMLWYKKSRTINGRKFDYLWASGRGGNQLIVLPKENMVIALTSTAYGPRYGHPRAYRVLGKVLAAIK
ncbi:serine hydrolase domain-containing protein [Roseivirga misakiensis]|uniref:Beta-lactamase-related domain-containing protein n=1 Tax=Roseivirga misakiensis TaxID=1563681 RepID=A0A1E5SL19_9BACT|nr:serine hydrolase [Roseivirga misakiensis]OEJ99825.1 hypothetical protein BFP71_09750 [Roseivirga misakiensis]